MKDPKWSWLIVVFVGALLFLFTPPVHVSMTIWMMSILLAGWLPDWIRTRKISRLANKLGYPFLGATLFPTCDLSGTSFALKSYSIRNLMLMRHAEIEIAIFDLSYRKGKGSCSQTIAAFRREGPIRGPSIPRDRIGSYQFEAAGDWLIAYSPGSLAPTDEMNVWAWEVYEMTAGLLEEADGKGKPMLRLFTGL